MQFFLQGGVSHAWMYLRPHPEIKINELPILGVRSDHFEVEFVSDEKKLDPPQTNGTGMLVLQYHMKDLPKVLQLILTGKATVTFTNPPSETGLVELAPKDYPTKPQQPAFWEFTQFIQTPSNTPVVMRMTDSNGNPAGRIRFWNPSDPLPPSDREPTLNVRLETLAPVLTLLALAPCTLTYTDPLNAELGTDIMTLPIVQKEKK
jgi:hypothetical protein